MLLRGHLITVILGLIISACSVAEKTTIFNSPEYQKQVNIKLCDSLATKETVLLFYNLKKLALSNDVIFGHHESTMYGVHWNGDKNRSDVKDVIKKFPGLYGWDYTFLHMPVPVDSIKNPTAHLVKEAYERGGVNTFCWHAYNPVTDKDFYDTTKVVDKIIPGGDYYLKYLRMLDKIVDYTKQLTDSTGKPIPIIFRPFHEFDGSWFWWGKNFCSPEEFKTLWITTVKYLRDKKGVRNFIYAFSPDRNFKTEKEFLERYPGDEYVDIVGMDNYWDFNPDGDGIEWIQKKLKIITSFAERRNKIAALTETGLEGVVNSKWWTDRLMKAIDNDSIKIAYAMVWRNANTKHHYAPYPGHPSAEDFLDFGNSPKIIFNEELPNLYSQPITDDAVKEIQIKKKIEILKTISYFPVL